MSGMGWVYIAIKRIVYIDIKIDDFVMIGVKNVAK